MGWKALKEHFDIEHIVHINQDGNICIGTTCIPEILIFSKQGAMIKAYSGFSREIAKCQSDLLKNQLTLTKLIHEQDEFGKLETVYYFDENGFHQAKCVITPHYLVTKQGHLLTSNYYFNKITAKEEAIKFANTQKRKLLDDSIKIKEKLTNLDNLLLAISQPIC